jgi:hypothetical protein
MTLEEKRAKKAAYMRGYYKRNPDKYAAALARQKERKASTLRYKRLKDDPTFKEQKAASHKRYYTKHKPEFLNKCAARVYGITPEEYAQRTSLPCEICGALEPRGKTGCGMQVDHDHDTGELRGTLCGACNRAIGLMRDDPERLESAAAYLRSYRKKEAA